jgi:hypothetical protein
MIQKPRLARCGRLACATVFAAVSACGGALASEASTDGGVTWNSDGFVEAVPDAEAPPRDGALYEDAGRPVVLASGPDIVPMGLAVNASGVFWPNFGTDTILECGLGGCDGKPAVLAANQNAGAIATDATSVYWGNFDGALMRCASSGGSRPVSLVTTSNASSAIAVGGGNVFWNDGLVRRCATSGCAQPTALDEPDDAGNAYPAGLALDATNVYWMESGFGRWRLLRCPVDGCPGPPEVLASGPGGAVPGAVATNGTDVFFATGSALLKCPSRGCNGKPFLLGEERRCDVRAGIAVDRSHVYWSTQLASDGLCSIVSCNVDGCNGTPTVLSTGDLGNVFVAVDDISVYWAGQAPIGAVLRLAK